MPYCMYLRKSRKDEELAQYEDIDVLARHETALFSLSKKLNMPIDKIYSEGIQSGDSIASRPVMQQVLQDVERGLWEGVFVVEVERLARGDTVDQGLVAQAFKYSNTKIITPVKTFDPSNEFDEEYFEFGLFMSRREYKTINRRMRAGELAAVQEGKFIRNIPPYGYTRKKLEKQKGFTLEIVPHEAEIVRYIFDLYVNGIGGQRLGCSKIARQLNAEQIKAAKGGDWTISSVLSILRNPVYIGKIKWSSRKAIKKIIDGKVVKTRPRAPSDKWIVTNGLHESIIENDIWDKAQYYLSQNPAKPIQIGNELQNPFAGLVYCAECGHKMSRKKGQKGCGDSLICLNISCKNVSSYVALVEEELIKKLHEMLDEYKLTIKNYPKAQNNNENILKLKNLNAELNKLQNQSNKIHDLLEQGIYSTEEFIDRNKAIQGKLDTIRRVIKETEGKLKITDQKTIEEFIINVENVLSIYSLNLTPNEKNELLKNVVEKVIYKKERGGHSHESEFHITIYPKLPYV